MKALSLLTAALFVAGVASANDPAPATTGETPTAGAAADHGKPMKEGKMKHGKKKHGDKKEEAGH